MRETPRGYRRAAGRLAFRPTVEFTGSGPGTGEAWADRGRSGSTST